jgi:hypothetical protein
MLDSVCRSDAQGGLMLHLHGMSPRTGPHVAKQNIKSYQRDLASLICFAQLVRKSFWRSEIKLYRQWSVMPFHHRGREWLWLLTFVQISGVWKLFILIMSIYCSEVKLISGELALDVARRVSIIRFNLPIQCSYTRRIVSEVTWRSHSLTLSYSSSMLSNSSPLRFVFRSPNRNKSQGLVSGLQGDSGACRN